MNTKENGLYKYKCLFGTLMVQKNKEFLLEMKRNLLKRAYH